MLNENQQKLVDTVQGQVVAVACPGSGKTTSVVQRAVHMVEDIGIEPEKILIITFTKASAEEMEARYKALSKKNGIFFGTIHSFCFHIIAHFYKMGKNNILRQGEQYSFFQNLLYRQVSTDDLDDLIRTLIKEISFVRNNDGSYQLYEPERVNKDLFIMAYESYRNYKQQNGKIDFDDMLLLSRKCLRENPEELNYWRNRFEYITVDEYQDTNRIQADLIYMLAGKNGNVCFVGDDDQSIYRFRAADSSILLSVMKDFPNCQVIHLDTNYRSLPAIIQHAGNLIQYNRTRFPKDFKDFRKGKGNVESVEYSGTQMQAEDIVKRIKILHDEGTPYEQIAVLYRNNMQNLILSGILIQEEIPFYTSDPVKDIHSSFIYEDIMAYARLANGIPKTGDFQKIMNRPSRFIKNLYFNGVSSTKREIFTSLSRIMDIAAQTRIRAELTRMFAGLETMKGKEPKAFMLFLHDKIPYYSWLAEYAKYAQRDEEELYSIFDALETECGQFHSFSEWTSYVTEYQKRMEKQRKNKKKEGVCMSTFHSSKGLEWEHVFIIDANEDITPSKKAETAEAMEEERRMFYVAVTRAKDSLTIGINAGTTAQPMKPSRFVREMGAMKHTSLVPVDKKEVEKTADNRKIPKVYAVRSLDGKTVNMKFSNWFGTGGCKEYVQGHQAVFMGFSTEEEAERYLSE